MALTHLSDDQLTSSFRDLLVDERANLARQLEHLAELDRRKMFFHYASLRSYLVEEFGIEEWLAERKIRAARMLKRFPLIKEKLESGKLNMTLLELAQGCAHRERLSDPELQELLEAISGKSCRSAMREIASLYPLSSEELPRDRIRPLTAELSEVRFVASRKLLDQLDEIRGLLAHSHPQITMGELIEVLATEYRERHHPEERAKRAEARRQAKENTQREQNPKEEEQEKRDQDLSETVKTPTAPYFETGYDKRVPTQTQVHELTLQAGYQCSYVDPITGKRCQSRYALEIHHQHAWSEGGRTQVENLSYLCHQHHARVSFLKFGPKCEKYLKWKRQDSSRNQKVQP